MGYDNLDRVDFIATMIDGTRIYAQSDHRTTQEYEKDLEISILFAAIRMLNARNAMLLSGKPVAMEYHVEHMPPDIIQAVVASTGGILWHGNRGIPYKGNLINVQALLDTTLGMRVSQIANDQKLDFSIEAMRRYERAMLTRKIDRHDDPTIFWTEVIDSASFAGEILRRSHGGFWSLQFPQIGPLPLAFDCQWVVVNLMGKAVKFIENGPEDYVASMVQLVPTYLAKREAKQEESQIPAKKVIIGPLFEN